MKNRRSPVEGGIDEVELSVFRPGIGRPGLAEQIHAACIHDLAGAMDIRDEDHRRKE